MTDLKKYLIIDKAALDDEIIRQPSLFNEVSESYAIAVSVRDQLKEELAVLDAEIDSEVRQKYKDQKKLTETMVKNYIHGCKDHQDKFAAYLQAKLKADKLEGLKDSFKQRSYMLRELANLYVANYFESSSAQGTSQTDMLVYRSTRQKLAEARERKTLDR